MISFMCNDMTHYINNKCYISNLFKKKVRTFLPSFICTNTITFITLLSKSPLVLKYLLHHHFKENVILRLMMNCIQMTRLLRHRHYGHAWKSPEMNRVISVINFYCIAFSSFVVMCDQTIASDSSCPPHLADAERNNKIPPLIFPVIWYFMCLTVHLLFFYVWNDPCVSI